MPDVNPEILIWARETAGLSLSEAAHALGINEAKGETGEARLKALETGSAAPTSALLERMSQKYRRPLLAFYLRQPPATGDRGQDFRKAPSTGPPAYDPTLDALIRDIKSRQGVVRWLLEDEESPPIAFVGSASISDGAAEIASRITTSLAFRLDDFRSQSTVEHAFAYLRRKIEEAGVFVILAGNLGSHHSSIPPDTFRGFAIADSIAPFVVINDQDAKPAWSFTALHEVAHVWLGATGVSGSMPDTQIERFCNEVAGRILLPYEDLRPLKGVQEAPLSEALRRVSVFADEQKVSRQMVAYRLLLAGLVSQDFWTELSNHFRQEWLDSKKKLDGVQEGKSTGPSWYRVRRHRLGPALLSLVQRSLGDGSLTYIKAGRVLGVKPRNVAPLLQDVSGPGGM